jgi:hypothetical protein
LQAFCVVGETGFEPATARPPPGIAGFRHVDAVRTASKIGAVPRLATLALAGVLWLGASEAAAAAPVKGGHYHLVHVLGHDRSTFTTFEVEVELTLANDGRDWRTRPE